VITDNLRREIIEAVLTLTVVWKDLSINIWEVPDDDALRSFR